MTTVDAPTPTTPRARWFAFSALVSMQLMIVVDVSIVTVALRSIQSDLGFGQERIAWVVTAYTIGFGGLLLLSGRLGDLVGRKRMFLAGLTTFTTSSIVCGFSHSQELLIAGRFVQGAGAAMAFAVAMGIIVTLFRDQHEFGKAMGAAGFAQAAGASVGILAGGLLTHGVGWHWVFFVNVPIGIIAGWTVARLVPNDRGAGLREGADLPGAVLVTAGLSIGVYTIATVDESGWASGHTLSFGSAAAVLLASFIVRQATAPKPLIPLTILRARNIAGANAVHLLMVGGMISANILLALYMQQVTGYSPSVTAYAFLPIALGSGAASLMLSARLNMRYGLRKMLLFSLTLVALGLVLAVRIPVNPSYAADILPVALLLGVGGGLSTPAVMTLAMSVQSPAHVGVASGLVGTSGMIGDAVGIAALTAVAAAHARNLIATGEDATHALSQGFHLSFGIGATVVLAAIVVAFFVLRTSDGSTGRS